MTSATTSIPVPRAHTALLELRWNELRRIERAQGMGYLEVLHGTVWLTATPASGDVLLREGDGMVLDRHWPVLVQALTPARIILLPGAPQRRATTVPAPVAPADAPARGRAAPSA